MEEVLFVCVPRKFSHLFGTEQLRTMKQILNQEWRCSVGATGTGKSPRLAPRFANGMIVFLSIDISVAREQEWALSHYPEATERAHVRGSRTVCQRWQSRFEWRSGPAAVQDISSKKKKLRL